MLFVYTKKVSEGEKIQATEQQKKQYIWEYERKEGIKTKIKKNPGLRSLANLLLNSFSQGEIRRFRPRFHNGYVTETWISANGNSGNRCGKHEYTLGFRHCGLAETHSLNSCIRKVYCVTESLLTVMFPQLENLADTRLSIGFPKSRNM